MIHTFTFLVEFAGCGWRAPLMYTYSLLDKHVVSEALSLMLDPGWQN